MLLTRTYGPLEFHLEAAAPVTVPPEASVTFRNDVGNVAAYLNLDGTAAGWAQFLVGSGTVTFDPAADSDWLLRDNSATALAIGATGATSMLVFDTLNGAEHVRVRNARLTTTDNVTGGTARVVGGRAAYNAAASAAVVNVNAVFSTGSYTIPAATLKLGTSIKFRALIGVTAVSGAGATAQIRVYFGGVAGTLVFDSSAVAIGGYAGNGINALIVVEGLLTVRADASAGAGTVTGYSRFTVSLVSAAAGFNTLDVAGSAAGTYTVAVNNLAAVTFDIAGVTDAAGTGLVLEDFYVEMVG